MVEKPGQSEEPFAAAKYAEIDGHCMAYIDEGAGTPFLFYHGNPSRAYLWRNVMRGLQGQGRLIAADFMGFGDSDKLDPSLGDDRYSFDNQQRYISALWDKLDLGDEVILVLHDLGSMIGFDWGCRNAHRVKAIIYMESIVTPMLLTDFPEPARAWLKASLLEFTDDQLYNMDAVDGFLLAERDFTETEQAYYRKPFLIPGEDRRPTFGFGMPLDGYPGHVAKIVTEYGQFFADSDIPKLLIRADPGHLLRGRTLEIARSWANQKEVTVKGEHFVQEVSPDDVAEAIVTFVRSL